MFEGKLTKLRRLEPEDASVIIPFWNNYGLRQYLPSPLPTSLGDMEAYIKTSNEAFSRRTAFVFGIEEIETSALVGIVTLEGVSWISRHASVGSLGIFNPACRGKGLGRDALLVLLDFAFAVLDLHCVYLWVESFNERGIDLYRKIGFSERGTMRELAYRNGRHWDVTVMDILRREFQDKHGILPKEGAV